ncbi:MAG: Icc protein [Porticoccaceae bacterium]|jgi:Icc protein|tara:strand:+ start:1092 stop:1880 length:789 start_codon:yes stop_codon:yes gene_type:complete
MKDCIQITQITDLHLGSDKNSTVGGVNTLDSFKAVLNALDDEGRGDDLLLLSGDLSGESNAEAYVLLNQLLVEKGKQIIWLPGNHDDSELMQKGLINYPHRAVVEMGEWGILTLDSSQPGTPIGHISEAQLQQVKVGLEQLAGRAVLIAMHHSPVEVGCRWLDAQKIQNADALYNLLIQHGNVKAVITGHVHQHFDGLWGELILHTTPSSCIQFRQNSDDFALSDQPPGYRWLNLKASGAMETGVEFITGFQQRPDIHTTGY